MRANVCFEVMLDTRQPSPTKHNRETAFRQVAHPNSETQRRMQRKPPSSSYSGERPSNMVELDERPVITESVVQPCACVLTSREPSPLDMLQLVFAPNLKDYEAFLELKGIHEFIETATNS